MAIKKYGPTTPGRRGMTVTDYSVLSKVAPERSLLEPMKKHSGRNNTGKITVRHQGGGNRTKYRIIDFKRQKLDVPATVKTIEYDPNRSAFICLVEYADGVKSYIICPEGLKVGDTVISSASADIKPGNRHQARQLPALREHPRGYHPAQHRAVPRPRRPAGPLRRQHGSADGQGEWLRPDPSALRRDAQRSPELHRSRGPGLQHRPRERQPGQGRPQAPHGRPSRHGGGEGRAPIGHSGPMTPWGKPALGLKTRKHHKRSDKLIVKRAGK